MEVKLWCESAGDVDGKYICVYSQKRSCGSSITAEVEPQEEVVRTVFGPNEVKIALPPYFIVVWQKNMVGIDVLAHYGRPGGEYGPYKVDASISLKENKVVGVVTAQ